MVRNVLAAMGADSAGEADLAEVEIAARSLCIRRFVTNAESHAKCLLGQPAASQCIAMLVLEVKKNPEIIEAEIDSRRDLDRIWAAIPAEEVMMG